MSKPSAISGDFANYRPVLSRKVLQLVIEVAIERQGEVFEALGYPIGGGSIPVAIARLQDMVLPSDGSCQEPQSAAVLRPELTGTPPGPRAADADGATAGPSRAVRQAGIVCREPEFWLFVNQISPWLIYETGGKKQWERLILNAEDAAGYVRWWCGVASRADIAPGSEAERRWGMLFLEYGAWRQRHESPPVLPLSTSCECDQNG